MYPIYTKGIMQGRKIPSARKRLVKMVALASVFSLSSQISFAQSGEESSRTLEEIIVTAEKRSESLQEVSLSVSAIKGEDLELYNIVSVIDLTSITPGLNATRNQGLRTIVSIRGIGQEANQNGSATPGVSYHVDGVYIASPFAMDTGFLDTERVEVLRGPQGTVYGQNSIAGSINVITKKPDFEAVSGEVGISLGNYDLVQGDAVLNLPLSENVAIRGALRLVEREGFTDNVSNGQDLDDVDNISGRVSLLWKASETVDVILSGAYFEADGNGSAEKNIIDPTRGARNVAVDREQNYELDSWMVYGIIDWDSPLGAFKSVTSIQEDDQTIARDEDKLDPAVVPSTQDISDHTQIRETWTQEFTLTSSEPLGGSVDWLLGAFYLDAETDADYIEFLDFPPYNGDYDVLSFQSATVQERKSWSVFAQTTFNMTEKTRLITGVRHTDESLERVSGTTFFSPARLFKTTDDATTGKIGLEWDVSEGVMSYASWSSGFRPGGINLTSGDDSDGTPALVVPTYESESVDAFEIGMKGDFADGRLRTNVAAFLYSFGDVQLMGTDPDAFSGGVSNLPEAKMKGIEAEVTAILSDNLQLEILASYLDTEITDDAFQLDNVKAIEAGGIFDSAARATAIENIKGNELAKSPDVTLSVSLRHFWDFDHGTLQSLVQYKHRGEFYHRYFNDPKLDLVPSSDLFNLSFDYTPNSGSWSAGLSVFNLADDDEIQGQFTDSFGQGATSKSFVAPRQVIARYKYRF